MTDPSVLNPAEIDDLASRRNVTPENVVQVIEKITGGNPFTQAEESLKPPFVQNTPSKFFPWKEPQPSPPQTPPIFPNPAYQSSRMGKAPVPFNPAFPPDTTNSAALLLRGRVRDLAQAAQDARFGKPDPYSGGLEPPWKVPGTGPAALYNAANSVASLPARILEFIKGGGPMSPQMARLAGALGNPATLAGTAAVSSIGPSREAGASWGQTAENAAGSGGLAGLLVALAKGAQVPASYLQAAGASNLPGLEAGLGALNTASRWTGKGLRGLGALGGLAAGGAAGAEAAENLGFGGTGQAVGGILGTALGATPMGRVALPIGQAVDKMISQPLGRRVGALGALGPLGAMNPFWETPEDLPSNTHGSADPIVAEIQKRLHTFNPGVQGSLPENQRVAGYRQKAAALVRDLKDRGYSRDLVRNLLNRATGYLHKDQVGGNTLNDIVEGAFPQ